MTMPTVEQFLESLGRGTWRPTETPDPAFTEDWDTSDATSNALLFPEKPQRPRTDSLAALRGGLVSDSTLRARVSAIVGPGATVRGIAQLVRPVFVSAATASNPAPTVEEIAKALLVYSEFYIPVPAMTAYADGLRIPLPIEIDQASGDWVVNGNTIRLWAGTLDPARLTLLDQRPKRLAQPDALAVTKEVADFLKAQTTPLARGLHLLARALTNPFREVFFFFEAMKQLAVTRAHVEVALSFCDNAVNHQVRLLASLTAGQAILRRVERMLRNTFISKAVVLTADQTASRTRALSMLDGALKPGGLRPAPRELPETPQQLADGPGSVGGGVAAADDPPAGRHRMVLGRDVLAGAFGSVTTAGQTFRGAVYGGRLSPQDFLKANGSLLNPSGDVTLDERLKLIGKLSATWSFLDAVRMRHRGILSAGLLPWSADDDTELPSLLMHFSVLDEDEFDLFFGIHGLGVTGGAVEATGVQHVVLLRVEPNGAGLHLDTPSLRRDFFGGTTSGSTTTFDTRWAARVRAAAIASPLFRAAQFWETASRFERIIAEVGSLKVGGLPMKVNRLISSELGVALILDAHADSPANIRADLQAALAATDPGLDDDALDRAVTNKYKTIRRTSDTPGRNKRIDALALDKAHGWFSGW